MWVKCLFLLPAHTPKFIHFIRNVLNFLKDGCFLRRCNNHGYNHESSKTLTHNTIRAFSFMVGMTVEVTRGTELKRDIRSIYRWKKASVLGLTPFYMFLGYVNVWQTDLADGLELGLMQLLWRTDLS